MSLNLTIVNKWGIWQCSDHRVTNPETGKIEDDFSVKHVLFTCPDGKALLVYAGAGTVTKPGITVSIADWIRETLRGPNRTLDQTCKALRENATRDLAPLFLRCRIQHMFTIAAFLEGRPWIVQIRNFDAKAPRTLGDLLDRFETIVQPIDDLGVATV